jgi:catechol 2,3-dioxygenase-like lactoylglutathione lyase family enzyme
MTGRIQLALNVDNLDESVAFYSKLFGASPAKLRPGYANFAIAEPPLKLILLENPGHGGSLNHLGVEVADTDAVDAEQTRLAEAGLASVGEPNTTCCYAKQNKFWVQGAPNGERWEIYTVLADSPTFWGEGGSQSRDAAEAALGTPVVGAEHGSQCCGSEAARGTGSATASAGGCC